MPTCYQNGHYSHFHFKELLFPIFNVVRMYYHKQNELSPQQYIQLAIMGFWWVCRV